MNEDKSYKFDLQIRVVEKDNFEYEQILDIRRKVFIFEQQVPEEIEISDEEESTFYLVTSRDKSIATGRYRKKSHRFYKIERVAVLSDFRGQGFGQKLIKKMIRDILSKKGKEAIPYLNSQEGAVKFYLNLGFHIIGEEFYEAGIKHFRMLYLDHFLEEISSL